VEQLLSLGATRMEATWGVVQKSVLLAVAPSLQQMSVVGLVTIPSFMSGEIIAGASPTHVTPICSCSALCRNPYYVYRNLKVFLWSGKSRMVPLWSGRALCHLPGHHNPTQTLLVTTTLSGPFSPQPLLDPSGHQNSSGKAMVQQNPSRPLFLQSTTVLRDVIATYCITHH
jgi:hypothetical protein